MTAQDLLALIRSWGVASHHEYPGDKLALKANRIGSYRYHPDTYSLAHERLMQCLLENGWQATDVGSLGDHRHWHNEAWPFALSTNRCSGWVLVTAK